MDRAIRGSTEKAVLAYSIHFSELIFCREDVVSLKEVEIKVNFKIYIHNTYIYIYPKKQPINIRMA